MALRRRKGSSFWWYSITVGGRRFRGSTKETSREAAKLVEATVRARLAAGDFGPALRLTMSEAFGRYWLEHAHALPSAYTLDYQAQNLIAGLGKETFLDRLTPDDIATYVARRRAVVSDASVNRELTLLRAAMNMARKRWGVRVADIDWKAQRLVESEGRTRYLRPEEADRLIAHAAPHLKAPIKFSLLTGVRLSNCIGLDWSQVDLEGREITFRVKSRRPGGKVHVVPISDECRALLSTLGPKEAGPVFTYRHGKRLLPRPVKSWRKAFRRACERAKISDFRWHDLRHTAASWMVAKGIPLDVVKDVLGHASIETTMRYAHREDTDRRKAMAALGAQFGHNPEGPGPQDIEKKKDSA